MLSKITYNFCRFSETFAASRYPAELKEFAAEKDPTLKIYQYKKDGKVDERLKYNCADHWYIEETVLI